MSASAPRIVVTGIGATTPVGGNARDTWESVLAGRSGARSLDLPWVAEFEMPVTFAATLQVDPGETLSKVETRRNDPSAQYALVAAREAFADAGSPEIEGERLGVAIGTGIGGVTTLLDQWDTMKEKGYRRVFPLTVPMLMANGPSAAVSLDLGAKAGARTTVSACASGAEAIGLAAEMIRDGHADMVICGGTEACVHPLPIAAFAAMQALSTRNDDPTRASRPYDVDRDGFVLGEGAAVVILEREDHARARGAKIYAEIASAGISSDAHHIAAPEPEGAGAAAAMTDAARFGDIDAGDIAHVNAHATSTPAGDVAEAKALRRAFGSAVDRMAVSATKSSTGHLLGAAGALEAVLTILSAHHRLAPPTINIDNLDPEIDLDVVRDTPRELPAGDLVAINNSFGFGGANVALAIRSI